MTAEDWKDIGLAVVGCIPIVGSVVAVGEALSEAYDGNYVDAGISLAGVIPFAGTAGKVAKFAKKGKIAGKILNLINKGKNLVKRLAKKAKALGGKMKTLSSHMMADARKAIENAAKKIAGKTGKGKVKRPYSHIPDSPSVGPGKKFTKAQKEKIIQDNMKKNGGVVRSDQSGAELVRPQKSQKGVKPDSNEWQIDHIDARSKGGSNSNSNSNAQVLSREENRAKSDK
ncbi:hypothetical protein [Anaerosinus massiliensis]|uniref:hypothetical protein n=1 Tax=Massilibacillus massiliensis TaxID=1806837 RepID=UPI000DA6165B|nr:hypothetical protein [Massilibacillus massiliensis]